FSLHFRWPFSYILSWPFTEELQAIHEYWRSMNQYSKQILTKEKVA
ncbi:hypothetical protein NE629_19710, partial [Enterococcus avium]|nr:hypothetical protein [Enterococcus avium]